MTDTVIEPKPANPKADEWAERIAAQRRSGISVKQFCKEQGVTECSFYAWRKRLQEQEPVRFALVERRARRQGGVEPFAWFRDILSRIPAHPITRLSELLPHNWKPTTSPAQA